LRDIVDWLRGYRHGSICQGEIEEWLAKLDKAVPWKDCCGESGRDLLWCLSRQCVR
jgi:hypothetical protein